MFGVSVAMNVLVEWDGLDKPRLDNEVRTLPVKVTDKLMNNR